MRLLEYAVALASAALMAGTAQAAPGAALTRAQALSAIAQPDAALRLAGLQRLARVGAMADAERVLDRLADTDDEVREAAQAAAWQIWSRSGDAAIDRLFAQGLAQLEAEALADALATFSRIVRLKPGFAEGWNKRATVFFLLDQHDQSLHDCEEVFKRNPRHFGALSGAGQIHLQRGDLRRALGFFRRALEVNPNLEGPAQMVPLIERRLREGERNSV